MKILLMILSLSVSVSNYCQTKYHADNHSIINKNDISELTYFETKNKYRIDLNTSWIYEAYEVWGDKITHINYNVVDTLRIKGKQVFKIKSEQGLIDGAILFSSENNKTYIYDTVNQKFDLLVDYNAIDSFIFATTIKDKTDVFTFTGIAYVDSIIPYTMPDNSESFIHYITYKAKFLSPNGSGDIVSWVQRQALRNIGFVDGNSMGGWDLGLWYSPLYEPEFLATGFRCFSNDSISYNFVGYSCDSVWVKTGVKNIDNESVIVFPNPTNNSVFIQLSQIEEIRWRLISSLGKCLQYGTSTEINLSNYNAELYFLEIILNDKEKRFLKIIKT